MKGHLRLKGSKGTGWVCSGDNCLTLVLLDVCKCLQYQGTPRWRDGHEVGERVTWWRRATGYPRDHGGEGLREPGCASQKSLSGLPALLALLWNTWRHSLTSLRYYSSGEEGSHTMEGCQGR